MGSNHDQMVDDEVEVITGDADPSTATALHWLKLSNDDGPNGPWEIEVHVPVICTLCEKPDGPFVAGQIHTGAPICASCFTKYLVCEHRNVSDEGDGESGPNAVCHDCGKSWR